MSSEPPVSLWPDPNALGSATDLYQLTMMAGYAASGMDRARATFELFVRKMPARRSYLVFAGLEQALADLGRLAFSAEQVEDIRRWPVFERVNPAWFDALPDLRFEGDVWAVPEGTIVFPGEPLVRVEAPLAQAQWVETFLLASLAYPTLVASKASRIVEAARDRSLFEFGARRGHGPHAAFLAARSAYLAGFDATSHVEAARRLGIPCVGTMAHSWVQAFDDEPTAFAAFARTFGARSTLLVDTYDTEQGVRHAATIEPAALGVRLDSGDLGALARSARTILDQNGRRSATIAASGDLDEFSVARLIDEGAPIDAFGIGTELITSRDAPALAMVYKLVAVDGQGRMKLSPGKRTYPLAKQVFRRYDARGRFAGDQVVLAEEIADGEPLLIPFLRDGQPIGRPEALDVLRGRCRAQREALPDALRRLDGDEIYPVSHGKALEAEAARLETR